MTVQLLILHSCRFSRISTRPADETLVAILKDHQQRSILCEEASHIIVRRAKLLPTAFNMQSNLQNLTAAEI